MKNSDIEKLENWNEITKGLYRYAIGANVAYEIHITFWYHFTDILTAQASLYLVGEWKSSTDNKGTFTKRECLLQETVLQYCLEEAMKDYNKNFE